GCGYRSSRSTTTDSLQPIRSPCPESPERGVILQYTQGSTIPCKLTYQHNRKKG
uniref:Uncharacterized protein n=1 Tax=Oryza brachyantha TaxID=4533 RepID=J3M212_ORYBR